MKVIADSAKENNKKLVEEAFLNRFENIEITSKVLCEIWDINPNTLSSYIKYKVVIPINPGSSKLKFNFKQILEMPNPKFRRYASI